MRIREVVDEKLEKSAAAVSGRNSLNNKDSPRGNDTRRGENRE